MKVQIDVFNVGNSYVVIDLAGVFHLCYLVNEWCKHFVTPKFLVWKKCSTFMKMFSLGVYGLKILAADLEICFVEQILDAVMKLAPIGSLFILKMQYI